MAGGSVLRMEARIGIVQTMKEITVEFDGDEAALRAAVEGPMSNGHRVLWFEDTKGKHFGIPADKIAYIEFGGDIERKVGFGR